MAAKRLSNHLHIASVNAMKPKPTITTIRHDLRKVLKPFAHAAHSIPLGATDDMQISFVHSMGTMLSPLTVGDLRRLKEAYKALA